MRNDETGTLSSQAHDKWATMTMQQMQCMEDISPSAQAGRVWGYALSPFRIDHSSLSGPALAMAQQVEHLHGIQAIPLSTHMLAGHASLAEFLDSRQCFICVSRLREVRAECGHLLGCRQCSRQLRDCPFCRRRIHWTAQCRGPRVRNESVDNSDTDSSAFSTDTAITCPPRLLYHEIAPSDEQAQVEAPCRQLQTEEVNCDICHTLWPDIYQWQEHLSQGQHRNAMIADEEGRETPFLEYCKQCAFYYHDLRSWKLHFELHALRQQQQDLTVIDTASQATDSSTIALPDLHSGVQVEPVYCGACNAQLVGLAQLLSHWETDEHLRSHDITSMGNAVCCPFCKQWLNGLDQWEQHVRTSRHRRKRREAKALWQATGLVQGPPEWPFAD